ncbi:MAG: flagellar biosynthetic protein FliR, partial [Janthinobacterium lividum]
MAQVLSASAFAMPPGSAWLVSSWMNVGLVSLRVAVVLALTPVLRSMTMPVAVRLLLVLAMSLSLSLVLAGTMATAKPAPTPPLPLAASGTPPAAALLQAALCELAIGATLALGILLAFAAFSVAGNLLDVQIGFGIGQVVDAASAHPLPIVAALFNQTAMLVFFLVDGHHGLLRGLAWSLLHFPAGAPWSLAQMDRLLLGQAAGLFSLGFALAAPVAF